ncbi:nuclear transport factor 2 family protein [Marinibaculum pumilum]|uniref:Nuclear transport factor 2 family protein n=1 Tax=Marinibaculum pumilum TaxID=1766165 RepID=A0ABV7L9D3_9PROT
MSQAQQSIAGAEAGGADPVTDLTDRYIAMWNETDGARRRDLIAAIWAKEGRYRDPALAGDGHAGIDTMVQAVQAQFPGHSFRRTSAVEQHNDRIRFGWELGPEGAEPLIAGVDFGVLAGDGRLQEIAGFFDKVPAAA